ncbi:MAG TPA: S41 family peptidase [Candidatus Angelobacter sp.]|nr:S41 family peptidase [Candidatus Angelobacter sp.]
MCKSLVRRNLLVSLSLITFSIGLTASIDGQDFSLSARQSDFKTFCKGFQESYAYIDRSEKPWKTWSVRYARAVDAADTPEAYAAVFESALDELHDFHAEVRSRNPHRWLPVPTFADIWAEFRGQDAVVVAVRKGSDAERAGLVVGDRVTKIDNTALTAAISDRLTQAVNNNDPKAREWALLSLLTGRSDEARHFTIRKSNGQTQTVVLPLERHFDRDPGLLSASVLPGDVGLIRFHNSLGEQKTVDAFDAALIKLRSTRGLILDLRDVPSGGNSSVALGIMGRFVTQMLPYQRHRIPHYGQTDVERNWFEQVAPRGPFTYKAPVVLLVDHWTGSMGEGMAIGFDAMHRALVIGTPMAHLAGAVSDSRLPETGIDVAFATEQLYHMNGMPRQDWMPPFLIEETASTGADVILKRGLSEIQRRR